MRVPACFGVFCLCLAFPGSVVAKEKLVISAIENAPNACVARLVLDKAYDELGIATEYHYASGKQALTISARGEVDGELARIGAVAERFPTLVKVDAPIFMLQNAYFTVVEGGEKALSEEDLASSKVGQLEGIVRFDQITKEYSNVWHGRSYVELFEMLHAGQLDVVIGDLVAGQLTLSKMGLANIEVLGGAIHREPLYHYLHEKNAELATDIGAVLGRMNDSGELIEIIEKSIADIISGTVTCELG